MCRTIQLKSINISSILWFFFIFVYQICSMFVRICCHASANGPICRYIYGNAGIFLICAQKNEKQKLWTATVPNNGLTSFRFSTLLHPPCTCTPLCWARLHRVWSIICCMSSTSCCGCRPHFLHTLKHLSTAFSALRWSILGIFGVVSSRPIGLLTPIDTEKHDRYWTNKCDFNQIESAWSRIMKSPRTINSFKLRAHWIVQMDTQWQRKRFDAFEIYEYVTVWRMKRSSRHTSGKTAGWRDKNAWLFIRCCLTQWKKDESSR